jgi:hypothetical protein
LSEKHRVGGKTRYDGATIAWPHEARLPHQHAQGTQNPILAAKITELARQECIFAD